MKITGKIETGINKQINAEMYSAYLYLSMSAYCESINLKGFANWMKVQAKEEMGHAMKFYGYVFERGGAVVLDTVKKPPSKWKSPLNVFEETYKHEKKITEMIYNLIEMAKKEKDYATENFLMWFIEEQVEEENSSLEILDNLKMIGKSVNGLMMLNSKLGKRGKE